VKAESTETFNFPFQYDSENDKGLG
jgi:hypothetical protein